jgi:Ala-tRNA(Pro) deacylase
MPHSDDAAAEDFLDDSLKMRASFAEGSIAMSVAEKLRAHLARKHVNFDLAPHRRTINARSSARAVQISPGCVAKSVLVRTRDSYYLAVLPASRHISWSKLSKSLGETCALATEKELDQLFEDCAPGAIPAVGECYGIDVIIETSICEPPDLYFEGGDHRTLVHVSQAQFVELSENARFAHFAEALE